MISKRSYHTLLLSKKANENLRDDVSSKKLVFGLGKLAFSLLPLTPESVGRRKTIFTEVVKDSVWTLDQIQGIINVNGKILFQPKRLE